GPARPEAGNSGPPFLDQIHPQDGARVRGEIERAVRDKQPFCSDYRMERPDGLRFLHVRGELALDEVGMPMRMVGVVEDVTDRKLVEARLVLADRLASVGTLAAGVA